MGGTSFSKTQIPKFSDDPIFCLQPTPSPVRRERAGERVALRLARRFDLNPQSHPHPNLPPPDGGRDRLPL